MKIQELEIKDIGGIPYLKLDNLNPQMNIICGSNGVGKTSILDSVAFTFSYSSFILKKRASSDYGSVNLCGINCNLDKFNKTLKIDTFEPNKSNDDGNYDCFPYNLLVYIKTNRVFNYSYLSALERAPDPKNHYEYSDSVEGVSIENLKNWFIHTHLLAGAGDISETEVYNINKAKEFISKLDNQFSFLRVTRFNDIVISAPSGEIFFEYLSSGFKSAFFILLGILKEIEHKNGHNSIPANEYTGIILIDEIELHLHPEWQGKIIQIIKQEFPKAQFFITTHSPHIIQSAEYSEIIALGKRDICEENIPFDIYRRELPAESFEYGFQGWSIEEILSDIMGMKTTYGKTYNDYMDMFNQALQENNKDYAQKAFVELDKMLHPKSHIKKMLQLEMIELE